MQTAFLSLSLSPPPLCGFLPPSLPGSPRYPLCPLGLFSSSLSWGGVLWMSHGPGFPACPSLLWPGSSFSHFPAPAPAPRAQNGPQDGSQGSRGAVGSMLCLDTHPTLHLLPWLQLGGPGGCGWAGRLGWRGGGGRVLAKLAWRSHSCPAKLRTDSPCVPVSFLQPRLLSTRSRPLLHLLPPA